MPSNAPLIMTPQEAATYTGFSVKRLNNWRYLGSGGPPFLRAGRSIRYERAALDAWIASLRQQPGGISGDTARAAA